MKPILFWLGEWPVRGYGAFVGAALVISMSLAVRYARRSGLSPERFLDASFAGVVGGLLGGRLMFVLVHAKDFAHDPLAAIRIWEGGMMYFGGLVLGTVAAVLAARRLRVPVWAGLDCIAPAIGAGQAVGRVACLLAGCCYGPPHDGPLGIAFHADGTAAPIGVSLLPVQLFQVAEGLLLFAFGAWAFRHRRWSGQAFLATLALAGVTRFLMEGMRGDAARGFLLPELLGETLSSSRAISIGFVVVVAALWTWRSRANAARSVPDGAAPA